MLESFENAVRQFGNFAVLLKNLIAFQDSDNFIVCFAVVNQTKSPNRRGFQNNIAARNVMFSQDLNIERIAVALTDFYASFFTGEFCDALIAVSLR